MPGFEARILQRMEDKGIKWADVFDNHYALPQRPFRLRCCIERKNRRASGLPQGRRRSTEDRD
jgi:hypothetical protein